MVSRIVHLLLCLLLVAKSSVFAALLVTGAAGYSQPGADDCPLAAIAAFVGPHDDAAVDQDDDARGVEQSAAGTASPHHHHTCPQLCQLQGAAPTTMALLVAGRGTALAPVPAAFTSFVRSPPVHPPRQHG